MLWRNCISRGYTWYNPNQSGNHITVVCLHKFIYGHQLWQHPTDHDRHFHGYTAANCHYAIRRCVSAE